MKNKTVWANRLKGKTSLSFQKIGSSISVDKRLYEQDINASIVHAKMLVKQKIISSKDGFKIINGLKKVYDNDVEALKGIDLKITKGDFFALLGPNGAGKSSTIGIISSIINEKTTNS